MVSQKSFASYLKDEGAILIVLLGVGTEQHEVLKTRIIERTSPAAVGLVFACTPKHVK